MEKKILLYLENKCFVTKAKIADDLLHREWPSYNEDLAYLERTLRSLLHRGLVEVSRQVRINGYCHTLTEPGMREVDRIREDSILPDPDIS